MTYSAKIVRDSVAVTDTEEVRLTTMEVVFPRFILAEFNTHRMFSRNSASSRAIPVMNRIRQVWNNPFVPESIGRNKSGMQAGSDIEGFAKAVLRTVWILTSKICCIAAWLYTRFGAHKQHANRLIELWSWHTVVVTSTEWENFFNLRTHAAAQPEMQIVAKLMKEAWTKSVPIECVYAGSWHLPYVDERKQACLVARELSNLHVGQNPTQGLEKDWEELAQESVVQCAAVSFERHETQRTREQVKRRFEDLASSGHWSPFEHQAVMGSAEDLKEHATFVPDANGNMKPHFVGNFRAPWVQLRKTYAGEGVWRGHS